MSTETMHAMVDIETLGLGPDHPFVITQIAMVKFRPYPEGKPDPDFTDYQTYLKSVLRARPHGTTLELNVDPAEQMRLGAHIEPETLKWWAVQNATTFAGTLSGSINVDLAIDRINKFLTGFDDNQPVDALWGNGKEFDLKALRTLYKLAGYEFPLGFWTDMDLRTLAWVAGKPARPSKHMEREDHNALSDAVAQVMDVDYYMRIIHGTQT